MRNRFGRLVAILSVAAIWMLASCQSSSHIDNKLTASDAYLNDYFGTSVAISGDVAIVGAPQESGGDGNPKTWAGAAYIFQLKSGEWVEIQKLTASDAQASDYFGGSVAISGNVAIVGALGAAYIFQLELGQWMEKQKLTASDAQDFYFGASVAISGNVAIVGVHGGDPTTDDGAAYVFQVDSGQWVEKQKLTASDTQTGDRFGESVAVGGNVIIVGAHGRNMVTDSGAAYIFQMESGQWVEKQKLTGSNVEAGAHFGNSVAINKDAAIVGAYFANVDPVTTAGAAYIFHLESGQWVEKQKLSAADAQGAAHFGMSVAISEDVAIVGADGDAGDIGEMRWSAGAAYVFQLESGQWVEKQKLTAADAQAEDQFGNSVAISGDVTIVGAYKEDCGAGDPEPDAGAAYLYQLSSL